MKTIGEKYDTLCISIALSLILAGVIWFGYNKVIKNDKPDVYRIVHVCDACENCYDYEIISYRFTANGIIVDTKYYGRMFLSEGTYMLFEIEACPLCARFYVFDEEAITE